MCYFFFEFLGRRNKRENKKVQLWKFCKMFERKKQNKNHLQIEFNARVFLFLTLGWL